MLSHTAEVAAEEVVAAVMRAAEAAVSAAATAAEWADIPAAMA
jgi:hypothetical protein